MAKGEDEPITQDFDVDTIHVAHQTHKNHNQPNTYASVICA